MKTYREAGLGDVPRPIGAKAKPAPMPPLRLVTPPPLPRALDARKPSEPIMEEVTLDPNDLEEADEEVVLDPADVVEVDEDDAPEVDLLGEVDLNPAFFESPLAAHVTQPPSAPLAEPVPSKKNELALRAPESTPGAGLDVFLRSQPHHPETQRPQDRPAAAPKPQTRESVLRSTPHLRDAWSSERHEQECQAIVGQLKSEFDTIMDLATLYRAIYGSELSEDATKGNTHAVADSVLGGVGRWFARDKDKENVRAQAKNAGLAKAKDFHDHWTKLLRGLEAKAETLPYTGDRQVLRSNLHALLTIPMRGSAKALAWKGFYDAILDPYVLAPVTAPLDIYRERQRATRDESRLQDKVMARKTTKLAEEILTRYGFQNTRAAIAQEVGKPMERLNAEDVLEYLYTTEHGQKILELQDTEERKSAGVNEMSEQAKKLYSQMHVYERLIRTSTGAGAEMRFPQALLAAERLKPTIDQANPSPNERALFDMQWDELQASAQARYQKDGRETIVDDVEYDLGHIEETAMDLLKRSGANDKTLTAVREEIRKDAQAVLVNLDTLLPEQALPTSFQAVDTAVQGKLSVVKDKIMNFCLANAKGSAQDSMRAYVPDTNPKSREAESAKVDAIHTRIAFLVGDAQSPIEVMRRAAQQREARLLENTGTLNTKHLEAAILLDLSDFYRLLKDSKSNSENRSHSHSHLIDVTERLQRNLSTIDNSGKLAAYILGGSIEWSKLLFGTRFNQALAQEIVQKTIQRTGSWEVAMRELDETKEAWLAGELIMTHSDLSNPDAARAIAKTKIKKALPEKYKYQADDIFASLAATNA